MPPDPRDTIVALSSAAGPGLRSIVRFSGDKCLPIVGTVFESDEPVKQERRRYSGIVRIPNVDSTMPAELYVFPGPRSYTGQTVVELHTWNCPPMIEAIIAKCLSSGARAAQAGEFTMRAFLAGKLDLTRAEAVHAVVDAGNRQELEHALKQLAGGLTEPLADLRSDLLDLLADIEAGLDFADEDVKFIEEKELLLRLGKGMALVSEVRRQLERRSLSDKPFRVALVGAPNAGKSSLFNALGGAALVSHVPGTTRDYLQLRLDLDGVALELIDTAGWQSTNGDIEQQAQNLGKEQLDQADLALYCVDATCADVAASEIAIEIDTVVVATKCDVAAAPDGQLATSAKTGEGLPELRKLLRDRARQESRPALAPSLSRCRGHVDNCLEHLRRAHQLVLEEVMPELLALEVRCALDQLGEMVGAVYTNDLLDRIFSRFCIGK